MNLYINFSIWPKHLRPGLLLFLLSSFLFPTYTNGQVYEDYEENFAYEVKQIDEFIERFNNDETLIKEYLTESYHQLEVSRKDLLKSLFNLKSNTLNKEEVVRFIEKVSNPEQPIRLSFYDEDWYAKVKCSVVYEGQERDLFLLLQVQQEPDGGSKWVVEQVYADFLASSEKSDSTAFLNPMSHATDFMGLNRAFENPEKLEGYLSKSYQEDQLPEFVRAMQNNEIQFRQVEDISYHFFHVDGWIFTVEDFQRPEKNSGWLISRLIPANAEEKEAFKHHLLEPKI